MARPRIRPHVRPIVRRLHLWLGLSLGVLFALMGLTGSALVFYQEIDAWLHPEVRVANPLPAPGWDSPVWDQALATVRARWPERDGAWRFEATSEPGALPARYQPPDAGHHGRRIMVWLSPDGRQVLREAEWGGYLMTWLYNLHMELLLHEPGRAIVGWSGLATLVLLLSGLWAWWPRGSWRKALHFKPEAVASRRLHDIHKLTGLAGLPLLLMLVGTGVMLALPDESNAVLARTLGPLNKAPVVRSVAPAPGASSERPWSRITLAQALTTAHREMPQARLAWVEAPGSPTGVVMVRAQQPGDPSHRFPHSHVYIDQHSGQVLAVNDRQRFGSSSVVNNWLHPLHDASVGGLGLRVLVAVVGVMPMALLVTGCLRWWGRRQKRRAP